MEKAPESQWMHCFYFCTLLKCVHGVWRTSDANHWELLAALALNDIYSRCTDANMNEKFVLCICSHNRSFEGGEREHMRRKCTIRMRGEQAVCHLVMMSSGLWSQQSQQPCGLGGAGMRCQDLRQSCVPVEPRDPARCLEVHRKVSPLTHVPSPRQLRGLNNGTANIASPVWSWEGVSLVSTCESVSNCHGGKSLK